LFNVQKFIILKKEILRFENKKHFNLKKVNQLIKVNMYYKLISLS